MSNYSSNQIFTTNRNNKQLSIFPLVDDNNVISQEPIYDKFGNFLKYLSNFRYVEIDNNTQEFKQFNILVDLDINLYNTDVDYRNTIYAKLLSFNRIDKICDNYNKYAGGLYFDRNTQQYEKYIEQEILDSLEYKQNIKNQQRLSSFEKKRQDFLRRTAAKPVHVKDSHAEVLTQAKYQEMYRSSSNKHQDSSSDYER